MGISWILARPKSKPAKFKTMMGPSNLFQQPFQERWMFEKLVKAVNVLSRKCTACLILGIILGGIWKSPLVPFLFLPTRLKSRLRNLPLSSERH